jgi:hypothetical protein
MHACMLGERGTPRCVLRKGYRCSVLTQHFTIAQVLVFVNGHVVGLSRDINNNVVFVAVFIHGPLVVRERLAVLVSVIGIEEDTEALDANTAEYTKNVSLMFVEFYSDVSGRTLAEARCPTWRCFATEGEEVFAEESVDARQAQMG